MGFKERPGISFDLRECDEFFCLLASGLMLPVYRVEDRQPPSCRKLERTAAHPVGQLECAAMCNLNLRRRPPSGDKQRRGQRGLHRELLLVANRRFGQRLEQLQTRSQMCDSLLMG